MDYKKTISLSLLLLFKLATLYPAQFAYPIANLGNDSLFVLYQQSVDDIELWSWSVTTGLANKELCAMFTPSDVQIMPGGRSFSFLDRGRIWIKSFCKRMPRSIDLLEPIDSIFSIQWITDEICYFSGRHYRTYDVFLCDISNGLQPEVSFVTHIDNADVLYPCKHEGSLYAILRDESNNYLLVEYPWCPVKYRSSFASSKKPKTLSVLRNPVCSLSIDELGRGLLIECISDLTDSSELLVFSCNAFNCSDYKGVTSLFDFSLPSTYLLNGSRAQLRESISRFLPFYIDSDLYFVDYSNNEKKCYLYMYTSQGVRKINFEAKEGLQFFSPFRLFDQLYCGIILPGLSKKNLLEIDAKSGIMEFKLPCRNI